MNTYPYPSGVDTAVIIQFNSDTMQGCGHDNSPWWTTRSVHGVNADGSTGDYLGTFTFTGDPVTGNITFVASSFKGYQINAYNGASDKAKIVLNPATKKK